ncbi:hypothetical protein F503_08077 [Ophiostoma piceae UAMH 11346]|uniref:Selenoprotein O n=1 Tax=Ophiostoma piceae (strain UAMH 11346) TaxID=1262450 RepID=S3C6B5_OPHP1|nr:hypothetical protein F503_08077 [Ophiostoma piceae UAMH 11346]
MLCRAAARAVAARRRLLHTTSTSTSTSKITAAATMASQRHTLADLPKSWKFTESLPPDAQFPSPAASHGADRESQLGPRIVRGALFTWVRPEDQEDPEVLAVSPAALRDLGIRASEAATPDFTNTVAGNKLWGWDELSPEQQKQTEKSQYPWAQCYGGYQFGQWAGQLGDGRAISLFEVPAPTAERSDRTLELQLKGAGMTPYSRFADGRAVLRSSIREFVVSEALNALGIPSTRALSLTLLPNVLVHREALEPAAIVARFAESWLRLGTFDLLRTRGERTLIKKLADYVAETVYGGWDRLPARLVDRNVAADDGSVERLLDPKRGVPKDVTEDGGGKESETSPENRYARLYREIVRRNARTVAHWQVYGFMNGVLNTDNTSVLGLSLDFGPFAFLDNFDPSYTPNHDDHHLRYSYRNQPSIIWWNLVRFGESLGELLAAGDRVDDQAFADEGVIGLARVDAAAASDSKPSTEPEKPTESSTPSQIPPDVERAAGELASHAEDIIMRVGEEYKNVFLMTYKQLFMKRLGLPQPSAADLAAVNDMDPLITSLLDVMEQIELDFNMFFRRLSSVRVADLATEEGRRDTAAKFFYTEGVTAAVGEETGRRQVAEWLAKWGDRVAAGPTKDDDARIAAMKAVNPNFVPRGWVLDEVIRRVEKEDERDVLRRIMHMALHPFADSWHESTSVLGDGESPQPYQGDASEEIRWTQDVPAKQRAMQCSCSS